MSARARGADRARVRRAQRLIDLADAVCRNTAFSLGWSWRLHSAPRDTAGPWSLASIRDSLHDVVHPADYCHRGVIVAC